MEVSVVETEFKKRLGETSLAKVASRIVFDSFRRAMGNKDVDEVHY